MKTKVENSVDVMYPNLRIHLCNEEIDFYTNCLVFKRKKDGTFDSFVSSVRHRFIGDLADVEYRSKIIIDNLMNNGRPLSNTLFYKEGMGVETPFYKNMTKDEVKNYFKECGIIYTGNIEV